MIADIIADAVRDHTYGVKTMAERSKRGDNSMTDLEICRWYRRMINSEMKALTVEIKRLSNES